MFTHLLAGDYLTTNSNTSNCRVKRLHLVSQSHIATDGQSVSLGVEPHLRLMTRYLLLFDSYDLVFVGHPLWREDWSAFFVCYWPLPVQSDSRPYFTVSNLRFPSLTRSCSSLYSLCTASTENTASNSYSVVASRVYRSDRVQNTIPLLLFTAIT
jgi:hypothetical protein